MRKIAIIASQLVGKVSIDGLSQAQADMKSMGTSTQQAQDQIDQLQNTAKDAGSILASRFSTELKNAQSGLQELGSQANNAGLDVSKFTELQQKASDAVAKLGLAQAQAAAAQEKANSVTNDASASAEKVALAQARAATAAENVGKAELAAGDAMTMVQGEATRLADALEATQAKGNIFSGVLGGMKEGASGFFGAISEAPGKLMQVTQEFGMLIFGVQQVVQFGQQLAGTFISLGKQAGDFQQGITQLSTGAGELTSNLEMVSQGILKLAPEVGTTTADLTAGMYQIESAGQHGAQALTTLQDAAEGAKTSNSALKDVANGVTTIMTDYARQNVSAAAATNTLVESVKFGKSTIGDMSKAMATILPTSAAMGVSLTDVSSAMSVMTHEGTPASQAATNLKSTLMSLEAPSSKAAGALKSIGLTSTDVSNEMKVSLPGALQLITDHLKNKFPEGSAAYVAALSSIVGGTRGMQGVLELTGANLQTFKDDVSSISGVVKTSGDSIDGWTQIQQEFNFQMQRAQEGVETLKITLGEKLFPVFTQVFGWVASTALPALNSFSNWFFDDGVPAIQHFLAPLQSVGDWFQNFVGHGQAAIPILAGIGAVIATLLVPAVWSLAAGVVTATWPFVAIGLAVAGVTAAFLHFYNTNAGFRDFINGIAQAFGNAMDFFANKAEQTRIKVAQEHVKMAIAQDENTAKGAQAAINNIEKERQGILQKLKETHDPAEQSELQHQLKMTDAQVEGQKVRLQKADEDKKNQLAKQKELHDQMLEAQKPWYQRMWDSITGFFGGVGKWFTDRFNDAKNGIMGAFGAVGKWFGDRWHDIQNIFGGIGQWFHDRFTEAKDGISSAIGGIGAWFHDRFQEAWNGITGFFGAIGKWFSDRWNDVMNSTAPFRTYMGDVFQTIWNILVAVWGKVSTWFHDRFTEAYNKVVEVFGPIGKWFQDRWHDVQNIFGGIGAWFHDRWVEVWNATTSTLGNMGKWFHDRWVDTQNVFGGIGAWFHDRWTEAWNSTTAAFVGMGKWFGDRWHDVQNIFAGIGNWFHDRWNEAWNKMTEIFSPIGQWFSDRWNDIKIKVSEKWNEIKTDASNIFRDIINGIVDHLNDGIGAIESFINFFGQGLDTIAKDLGTTGTVPVVHLQRIPHYAEGGEHPGGPAIVGEKGREMVFLPAGSTVVPNDITETLLSLFSGGKVPGYAGGIGDIASSIASWISGGAKSLLDNVIAALHIQAPDLGPMSDIASGIFNEVKGWALSWVSSILPKFSSLGTPANMPGNLASWIMSAIALTSTPGSWLADLETIAMHESGGNPNAVNNWDINAQEGHPSQGLFQTIPSTFSAYALPGHGNILNPIDNAAAAIGYIKSRYGDVFHVPGIVALSQGGSYVGYANGGVINEPIAGVGLSTGTRYAFGENGKELVTPYASLASQNNPTINVVINVQPNDFNIDGRKLARALMPHHVELVRQHSGVKI